MDEKTLKQEQKEMKARMRKLKKTNPSKWLAQEAKDLETLNRLFPKELEGPGGHRKSSERD